MKQSKWPNQVLYFFINHYKYLLVLITFQTYFTIFVFQRCFMFKSSSFAHIPHSQYKGIDLYYFNNNSNTDIVYCHGSIINGKVYKKLLEDMASNTKCNVLSFNIRGMFNKRGVSSEMGIKKELDILVEYILNRNKDKNNNISDNTINNNDSDNNNSSDNTINDNTINDNNNDNNKKYIFFGQSLGCSLAIYLNNKIGNRVNDRIVRKCILENPFLNYKSTIDRFTPWKYFSFLLVDKWINNTAGLEALFLLSTNDKHVSNNDGLTLSKMCKGEVRYLRGNTHFNSARNKNYYKYINEYIK